MTDRCFSLLFWTFLAVSLQPALELSVLSQSLKDFDGMAFSEFCPSDHTKSTSGHTHISITPQYGNNKHLKTTGRVGKIPEVNQPGKQVAKERLTHELCDTVKDLHNFPRKNFITFNCKILMATPFLSQQRALFQFSWVISLYSHQ